MFVVLHQMQKFAKCDVRGYCIYNMCVLSCYCLMKAGWGWQLMSKPKSCLQIPLPCNFGRSCDHHLKMRQCTCLRHGTYAWSILWCRLGRNIHNNFLERSSKLGLWVRNKKNTDYLRACRFETYLCQVVKLHLGVIYRSLALAWLWQSNGGSPTPSRRSTRAGRR